MNTLALSGSRLRIVASFLLAIMLASPVLADTVMMRSGQQVKGTLANREMFRVPLPRMESVAILVADSTSSEPVLRRFGVAEVDAVVLEQDGKLTVFDLKQPAASPRSAVLQSESRGISEFRTQLAPDGGAVPAVLTLFGIASFALGVGVKFGGPTVKITSSGITGEKNSYNGANYTLMGMGLALASIGIVSSAMAAHDAGPTSELESASPRGAIPPTTYVGVRVGF